MNSIFLIIINNFKKRFFFKSTDISTSSKYLCCVSGGQDSTFLFFLLLHVKAKWGLKLHIIHCHHLWQLSNFFSFKQAYKLTYFFKTSLSVIIAEKLFINELHARNWRKDCYNRISNLEGSNQLLLGHTASDLLETAFLNLARGASPQGLCGLQNIKLLLIPYYINIFSFIFYGFLEKLLLKKKKLNKCYKSFKFYEKKSFLKKQNKKLILPSYIIGTNILKYKNFYFPKKIYYTYIFCFYYSYNLTKYIRIINFLVRPLLEFHRNDLIKLAQFYNIPIIADFSNINLFFLRNKVRHKIFRKLRSFVNLSFDYKFYQYLDILVEEQNDIAAKIKKILKKAKNSENLEFRKLTLASQRRFLYLVLNYYKKIKCNFVQVEYVRSVILEK